MLGKLALQRTNWAALAVLAALAVALFAVLQPASAANVVKVSINDSDNIVKAGAGYEVGVHVMDGTTDNSTEFTLEYLTVSGGTFLANIDAAAPLELAAGDTDPEATLVVPEAAAGVYTITAGVLDTDGGPGSTALRLVGSLEVTVGDVGTPIGSVEVVLGKVAPAGSTEPAAGNFSTASTAVVDRGTKRMGSNIAVTVNVLNSLGNKPNDSEVNQVLLFTPAASSGADSNGAPGATTPNSSSASATPAEVGASENFFVTKGTSGTVDVHAVAIGTGGSATSSTLTLTFTGDADTIALGDVSSPLPTSSTPAKAADGDVPAVEASGFATLKITAVDAAGNTAALDASDATPPVVTGLSFAFKDSDDNAVTGKFGTALSQAPKAGQETCVDTVGDTNTCDGTTVILTLTTTGATPGTYTLEATFGQKEAVTTEVVVAGPPANIELSSTHETVELGNIVTVTAAVTDKDGHAVTNENSVTFVAVGSLELTALDSINPGTKHGEAMKVRYVVHQGQRHSHDHRERSPPLVEPPTP